MQNFPFTHIKMKMEKSNTISFCERLDSLF